MLHLRLENGRMVAEEWGMKLKHLAAVFAFTILVAFAILYYVAFYKQEPQDTNIIAISPSAPKPDVAGVTIGIKDEKTLILSWQNLPTGTSRIDIFRAKLACESWSQWKTTAIEDPNQGSVEIKSNENISSNCFYFKAVSGSGAQLWSSTPQSQIAHLDGGSPSPQEQPKGSGIPNQPTPPPGSPPATLTSSTQSQPTNTPPPPPLQNPTSTSNPTTTYNYYNPQGGGTTSTNPIHTENFWVEHVNQRIEIGWQNMPSGTDKIVVSRSVASGGPWSKLFEQQGPFENKPYVIRLLDETINSPRYYKLEALSSGTTLQTFGPLLLPALGQ